MTHPTDVGTRLHPTGAMPRPRHPSGRPTITPIKTRDTDEEVPRATRSLYGSSSSSGGGKAAGAKLGEWINKGTPARKAAPRTPEPKYSDSDTDEPDARFSAPVDMNETWEAEAAEEMASDMWLDELELRMAQVYERVGRQQQQYAENLQRKKTGAGEDDMGMTNAFEQDLVNDQQAWMQELEREIASVYEGMGKAPPPVATDGVSPATTPADEPSPEHAAAAAYEAKHSSTPQRKAPAAAAAPPPEAASGSVSNLVDGLESLRAVAEAEEERARDEAVARSRNEADQRRSEIEAAEDEARAAAIARSRKEAEEQRLEARMRKNKAQAAQDLRKNQAQRVHDLREQAKGEEAKAVDKQKAVSEICDRLAAKVKNKSFPAVLESFGIKVNREDCEGKRIPEAEALAKAYKKAMVKFHPDRAQQRGLGEAAQMEAEETYKVIQNLYENYRRKASPTASSSSSGSGSGSGSARSGAGRGNPRQGHYGQRAGGGGSDPRPRKPSGGGAQRGYADGGGGGPQRQKRPGSANTAREQRAQDNERYKPDWQKRAEAAAREHARPKEHRDDSKFTGAGGGSGAPGSGAGQDAGGRQAKQDAAHARARYQHKSSSDGDGDSRGAELRREVERRPKARRVAEQSLRELVRRQRLWFRNAREKQQLRDILFSKAMKGKAGWTNTDEQTLQQFIGTLRSYS